MSEYISREEMLKAIQPRYAPAINKVLAGIIESVPAADVKPVVRGRWIVDEVKTVSRFCHCSNCGEKKMLPKNAAFNFCSNCGAEMAGVMQEGDGNGGGRKST